MVAVLCSKDRSDPSSRASPTDPTTEQFSILGIVRSWLELYDCDLPHRANKSPRKYIDC